MAADKKMSQLDIIMGADIPDNAYIEVYDPEEVLPENQNKRISVIQLKIALGVYIVFTATGVAGTTLQDDRLIGTDLVVGDIKQLIIGGTEVVSLGYVASLDNTTGTISFSAGIDFGGAEAIITLTSK